VRASPSPRRLTTRLTTRVGIEEPTLSSAQRQLRVIKRACLAASLHARVVFRDAKDVL
jgi:hypothetical protein